jgi:hypothetical protein
MSTDQDTDAARGSADAPGRPQRSGSPRARWGRRAIITSATVVSIVLSGIAFAGWGVTGDGRGVAEATSALELDIVDFELAKLLYPGLTTGATLTISNPNPFPVEIREILFTLTDDDIDGDPACTVFSSQVTFADVTGAALYLGADSEDEFVLDDVAEMGTDADDKCQGASFDVAIDLIAESTVEQ